ncbi:CubicO group peptidase (beta-lactamase class C family) [Pedobacter cryoconitis]|uniref:CubicO group peptidase (Beta-lactamase class C family) n=1 Tax=Pedobacter cryoconitis TaxID=188932 RepID=A0A7W8ZJW0_9SPHI|nr:serine hydrolase domain-containing protein [Pedobacter cryoconitis]MBB5635190.1 CubicO group peptidase (beta-lactamase class C family) [Pedobacter cryoconitis]MBB6271627.1 CubicO group peptidase (beta-lactamase class C family) [Pedobacter cryoconitis]
MKNRIVIIFLNLLLLSLIACKKEKIITHQFSVERIEELHNYLLQVRQAYAIPGLSVGIVHKDSVFNTTLGIADQDHHAIDALIPFSAGSISEPMLATAVLKMLDSGLIQLDDPVQKYLPYFKTADKINKKITIRHLLSHTSGIQHYPVLWDTPDTSANAPENTTRSISSQQLKFPVPGSRILRSPYNYDILADLITKVTRAPFEQYIRQHVFEKLGMKSSSFSKPKRYVQPFSIDNWLTFTSKTDSLYPYNRENGGSNGLHTTAADLSQWMEMLLNKGKTATGIFVKRSVFDDFFSIQYRSGKSSGITLGWELSKDDDQELLIKKSEITSFQNQVILIPKQKTGITFLSNISAQPVSSEIIKNITNWLNGASLPVVKIPVSLAMGNKLQETGSIDSAINLYHLLKKTRKPRYDMSLNALNSFGNTLFKRIGDKTNALKIYQLCTQEFPKSALPYLGIADIYIKSRSYANAVSALEKSRPLMNKIQLDYALSMEQYIRERTTDQDPG